MFDYFDANDRKNVSRPDNPYHQPNYSRNNSAKPNTAYSYNKQTKPGGGTNFSYGTFFNNSYNGRASSGGFKPEEVVNEANSHTMFDKAKQK